jgi:uncharacterized protein (DUF58 family)
MSYLEKRFQSWLDKRIPSQHEVELNQRRIFIFPSVQTLYFFAVLLLLLVAGINYQNNLVYGLVFFLASLFNTSIIFTFLNVSKLRLRAGKASQVYAGDYAEFDIELSRLPNKVHHRLHFSWPDSPAQTVDLVKHDKQIIHLHCKTHQRGLFKPGRLLLESYYPLGLIRCWSWIDLNFETIVYPKPIHLPELPTASSIGYKGKETPLLGKEDFYGFREYVKGDSLRQVHWHSLAKGQALQTKVYAAQESEKHWIDWHALQCYSVEEKLSKLCDWVLQLDKAKKPYGLRLPNLEISPDVGDTHKKRVLTALALFDMQAEVAHV